MLQTLTLPRALIAMAIGKATADATEFELLATRGDSNFGICVTPILDHAFQTQEYSIKVTIHRADSWSYAEVTVLKIRGQDELFHHTDRNTLRKIGEPTPNPMARK